MNLDLMREQLQIADDAIALCQTELPPVGARCEEAVDAELLRVELQSAADSIDACQAEIDNAHPEPPTPDGPRVIEPGEDVQQAITEAAPGAVLAFRPGERYVVGTLVLADKPITLESAAPLPERRITPDDALPILASGGPMPTIDGTHATGLTLRGLDLEARADGLSQVVLLQEATDVLLDRIRIIGGANGQRRGICGNGVRITLTRSHIANCWRSGEDSQAFCAWNGAGPYTLTDNYLEAASENVMFGGSDSASEADLPSDILIEGNVFTKRREWGKGAGYAVKNLFELKVGRRVVVRRNTFDGCWTDAQNGYAFVIKSVNQDGNAPWSVTEDVTFEENILLNTENGAKVTGWNEQRGGCTTGIVFRHEDYTCSGVAFEVGSALGSLVIEQSTIKNGYTFLSLYAEDGSEGTAMAVEALTVRQVAAQHNDYGVKGEGTGIGQPSLDRYAGALDWADNLLEGFAGKASYPPTTYTTLDEVPDGIEVGV